MENLLDNYITPTTAERHKFRKRADNVKKVRTRRGKVYVCPYPKTHFDRLVSERNRELSAVPHQKKIRQ